MEFYLLRNLAERLARKQRMATLAAGVKATHPQMSTPDVVRSAEALELEIDRQDVATFGHED